MSTSIEARGNRGQAAKSSISLGDAAPDFTLPDQEHQLFHLADHIGQSEIVLYALGRYRWRRSQPVWSAQGSRIASGPCHVCHRPTRYCQAYVQLTGEYRWAYHKGLAGTG